MKKIIFVLFLVFIATIANSQIIEVVEWLFESKQNGNEVELNFIATIDEGWHIYDTHLPEGGPIATEIIFDDSTLFSPIGELLKNPQPVEKFDSAFQLNIRYFSNKVTLTQKIQLLTNEPLVIEGYVLYMSCDDEVCLAPSEVRFSFSFNNENNRITNEVSSNNVINFAQSYSTGQTLWIFILLSVLAGFAATLTPCVFPMIPMTVSFFMKESENRGKAIRNGIFFGLSIILIFTLLGALFSFGVFGPNVGNILSTHWIPNFLFFALFLIFSMSFFGAFEMVLFGSLVNKTDAKVDKGGIFGVFFMALTTVIISFSCAVPFVGALIIEAVQSGGVRPLIGMFFFGLAFATPFTLLAIFPSVLNKLPKSGAWLNAVKVAFAFILLSFSLKFLSNIDQVYGLGIISREIYLSIWIVIFFLLGLYFIGKIKFYNDSDLPYIGVARLFLSIATFSFVIYLLTGLFGNPLISISSLIPPASTQTVFMQRNSNVDFNQGQSTVLCGPAKYADKLHLPHGLSGYFDFEQGIACAKEQGKPALVVFKGHACANCKKMENTVWANPEVLKILSEKYIIIGLYTDDRTTLPENEWVTSEVDGKLIKQMGKKNLDIEISKYNTNSIPFHVIIKPDGIEHTLSVTFRSEEFKAFLEKGI